MALRNMCCSQTPLLHFTVARQRLTLRNQIGRQHVNECVSVLWIGGEWVAEEHLGGLIGGR